MRLRYFLPLLTLALVVLALTAAFTFVASPVETANACNPCDCPEDRRINCQGIHFYGIYTYTRGDTCYIDAYRMQDNGSPGRRAWRLTSADLAELPEQIEENELVVQNDAISFYQLTSGEYQASAGPDGEGKIYYVVFRGCPADERHEGSFVPGA